MLIQTNYILVESTFAANCSLFTKVSHIHVNRPIISFLNAIVIIFMNQQLVFFICYRNYILSIYHWYCFISLLSVRVSLTENWKLFHKLFKRNPDCLNILLFLVFICYCWHIWPAIYTFEVFSTLKALSNNLL